MFRGWSKNIFLLVGLFFFLGVSAQEGNNPFELKHRIKKVAEPKEIASPIKKTTENPFDIVRVTKPINSIKKTQASSKAKSPPKKIKKEIAKKNDRAFLFWLISILTALTAILLTQFRSTYRKSYKAFLNDNVLRLLHREQRALLAFPYRILYLFFLLNAGIYAFLLLKHFELMPSGSLVQILSYCIAAVSLAFLIKHFLLSILSYSFPIKKEVKLYNFTIVIFNIILGLALVPFNILIALSSPELAKILIYISFLGIALIYLFRYLRGLVISSKYLVLYKFHFFMYLCGMEIAPFLIVLKLILIQIEGGNSMSFF